MLCTENAIQHQCILPEQYGPWVHVTNSVFNDMETNQLPTNVPFTNRAVQIQQASIKAWDLVRIYVKLENNYLRYVIIQGREVGSRRVVSLP